MYIVRFCEYDIMCCLPFHMAVSRRQMSLKTLKTILIDLSGTLHIEDEEISGSVTAIKRLQQSGLKVKYVTNTTKESKRVLLSRLNKIGFNVQQDEIFTSLTAARNLIEQRKLHPMLLLDDKAVEDFEGIVTDKPNAVVVGLAPSRFNYADLNNAFRLVLDGCPLIAIHKGRYYRRQDGLALGPGPFVAALEYASGRTAEVVGKPETNFFHSAIGDMNCQPEECLMVGDDVRDDVGGAQAAGMTGILVRTGKYREGDEGKIDPAPYKTVSDFAEAVEVILDILDKQAPAS